MVAILYIIASIFLGGGLILIIMPYIKNRLIPFVSDKNSVSKNFLFFPAAYLVGTLILSWITYFLAVIFKNAENPLLYANLYAFLIVIASVFAMCFFNRTKLNKWFYEFKKYGFKVSFSPMEWFILLFSAAFWSFFMFRSLYMDGNVIRVGVSAFSDFGAHLPVVRNFSEGQNFPAQYPHFPDGTMRYHFMFYFYAANLEYLGLNIAWAINLPSILSLVSFSMLLYGLCVGITNKTVAGFLTCVFFAFRSSFAFFTYTYGFKNFSDFMFALKNNLYADGSPREHIGNTLRENWGLWAQKVYVNQRHLAFAMGLFILALYLLLPLFMNTIRSLRQSASVDKKNIKGATEAFKVFYSTKTAEVPKVSGANKTAKVSKNSGSTKATMVSKDSGTTKTTKVPKVSDTNKTKQSSSAAKTQQTFKAPPHKTTKSTKKSGVRFYITEIFLTKDAWLPEALIPCILSGLLLGLIAFWNGAVVIAAISVFFVMAAFSKHKLEYLVMAVITFLLSTFQSKIFVGSGTGSVSIQYKPGFLTESSNITIVSKYYTELLGILPFVLFAIFIAAIARKSKPLGYFLSVIMVSLLIILMPSVGTLQSILIIAVYLALLLYITFSIKPDSCVISPWYVLVFAAPMVLASTLQLTPDITVNHKYIMLSVILLNIPVSDLLARLFSTRKKAAVSIAVFLIALLTITGIVDVLTLYNLDKNSVSYNEKESVKVWVQEKTNKDDIFLTHFMTHYGAPMSIMLGGRSLYSGYPYFTMTAGYDVKTRDDIMKMIYSATSSDNLRLLAISENIDYIVIEEQNRTAAEYNLNEELFHDTFPVVFTDEEKNIFIFKVE